MDYEDIGKNVIICDIENIDACFGNGEGSKVHDNFHIRA